METKALNRSITNRLKKAALSGLILICFTGCGKESISDNPDIEITFEDNAEKIDNVKETDPSTSLIDFQSLGVQEFDYTDNFTLDEDLKSALENLALSYDSFDEQEVQTSQWKEWFISKYICNSRYSFEYLNQVAEENNGLIDVDNINYMNYSLTGVESDFSDVVNEPVDSYQSSSGVSRGFITDYSCTQTIDGYDISGTMEVSYDGSDAVLYREINAKLKKNPYSCFDGYSIIFLTTQNMATPVTEPKLCEFVGGCYLDSINEETRVCTFEVFGADEELPMAHFVEIDLSDSEEMYNYVCENAGKDMRIQFEYSGGVTGMIDACQAKTITLVE